MGFGLSCMRSAGASRSFILDVCFTGTECWRLRRLLPAPARVRTCASTIPLSAGRKGFSLLYQAVPGGLESAATGRLLH